MMTLEQSVERMAVLSFYHLKRETAEALAWICTVSIPFDYGTVVWVPVYDVDDFEVAIAEYPDDLKRVMRVAHQAGIVWIKFDCDGCVVAELPVFDWDKE